jgi:hypothetical protein
MIIPKHNVALRVCPHPSPARSSTGCRWRTYRRARCSASASCPGCASSVARPMLQEDLTHETARILHEGARQRRNSAVYIEGLHIVHGLARHVSHEARVVTPVPCAGSSSTSSRPARSSSTSSGPPTRPSCDPLKGREKPLFRPRGACRFGNTASMLERTVAARSFVGPTLVSCEQCSARSSSS